MKRAKPLGFMLAAFEESFIDNILEKEAKKAAEVPLLFYVIAPYSLVQSFTNTILALP